MEVSNDTSERKYASDPRPEFLYTPGFSQWTIIKSAKKLKMGDRGAKWTKIWASGVLVFTVYWVLLTAKCLSSS